MPGGPWAENKLYSVLLRRREMSSGMAKEKFATPFGAATILSFLGLPVGPLQKVVCCLDIFLFLH